MTAPIDPFVRSSVEGVPVWRGSRLTDSGDDGAYRFVEYTAPKGVTQAQLKAWYEKRIPPGAPYHRWIWCPGMPIHPSPADGIWVFVLPYDDDQVLLIVVSEFGGQVTVDITKSNTGLCLQ